MATLNPSADPSASTSTSRPIPFLLSPNRVALQIVITLMAFAFFAPLVWLVISSLKNDGEVMVYPIQLLPSSPQWDNYIEAVTVVDYGSAMLRSFLLAMGYATLTVLSSAFVGFGFARHRAPGRDALFFLVVSMLILPQLVVVLPQFVLYSRYGLTNSYLPWVLWGLCGAPIHIFLFRQFFASFPVELEDAAEIDGCGRLRIFFQIFLPNAITPMIAVFIFSFNWVWGDFFTQALFLAPDQNTIAMLIAAAYRNPQGFPLYSLTMAGSVVYILPLVVVFLFAQRYFIEGVVTTGIKG
jgi:multiple sugar transport system permease protein